jgi:CPA2 family monovalent cation:H+ antiporter-2
MILRRLRSEHDLFLIVSVASGLTLAAVGSVLFGIPMALAAFVAGLAIGEGHDAAEARRRLLPFRDVFAVLFFVALGSLLDPAALPAAVPYLVLVLALVLLAKTLPIAALARLAHLPGRPSQVALGLSQVGEFGFVLASLGVSADVISRERFTAVIATVVITTAASAILARVGGGSRPASPAEMEPEPA